MKKAILLSILFVVIFFWGCGGSSSQNQPKTYTLTVKVVDSKDNSPIQGANVTFDSSSGTTDNSGQFVFKEVASGNYKVSVSKEGYSSNSQEVVVDNASKTITISLSKQTFTELSDLSKAKSYFYALKGTKVNGQMEMRIEIYVDNYGKQERLVSYNSEGKVDMEVYVVGDKGLIKGGVGDPMNVDAATARNYIESISSFGQNFVEAFKTEYNTFVVTPGGEVTVKVSKDTQNGYSTDKVEYTVNVSGAQYVYTGWVINSGDYKGFLTKLLIENKDTGLKADELKTIEVNIKDFGKSFNITF